MSQKNERAAVAALTRTIKDASPRMSSEQARAKAVSIAKKYNRDKQSKR